MAESLNRRAALRVTAAAGVTALAAQVVPDLARAKSPDEPSAPAARKDAEYSVKILNFLPHVARGGRISNVPVHENSETKVGIWFQGQESQDVITVPAASDSDGPRTAEESDPKEHAETGSGKEVFFNRPQLTLKVERLSETKVLLDTKLTVATVDKYDPGSHLLSAKTTTRRDVRPVELGEEVALQSPDRDAYDVDTLFKLTVSRNQ